MSQEVSNARVPQWTVGDRLRKAREEADLGVEQIATMLGRNRNSITRYERSRTADVLVVRAYATITNTPMEWLLTGFGPEDDGGVTDAITLRKLPGIWSDNNLRFQLKVAA